ncbi:MAG: lytic transglycosylase domain-containing protein [Deltaproteobacteria bacterium]|nr:lytic transglycosylase domain-containing protein [Deltaproteobacteria bacterium]
MKSTNPEAFILIRPSRTPRLLASSLVAVITLLGLAGNASCLGATVNNKDFPTYPAIQNNVTFWEKIYTKYSTSEAVIHDKHNVTKIYEVIPIIDYLRPGAEQINKPLLDTAKQKYIAILSRLAMGNAPITKEEHRIAAMYKGARKSQLQKASESVRVQIGQKERFREGVVRSGAYLPEIKRIFRSYNLPEELAYLPHVESSFNPDAYSKVGACGLWQFTRTTGKQYLRIDHTIDERQNPFRASHAAAKFLKRNHSILGSWPLALTAYNYGTSGMARAKKDKGSYEKIFLEYEEGYFKFASRNFYPEFLAAIRAAQELEKNLSLHRHKLAPITTVQIEKRTSTDTNKPSLLQGKKHLPKEGSADIPATHRVIKKERL